VNPNPNPNPHPQPHPRSHVHWNAHFQPNPNPNPNPNPTSSPTLTLTLTLTLTRNPNPKPKLEHIYTHRTEGQSVGVRHPTKTHAGLRRSLPQQGDQRYHGVGRGRGGVDDTSMANRLQTRGGL
jgi:hypothetical protein